MGGRGSAGRANPRGLPRATTASADPETRLREAYRRLAPRNGGWVGIGQLRQALPDIPRPVLDEVLRALQTTRATAIVPEDNQKILTPADHDSAIRLGGQHKHYIAIDLDEPHHRDQYLTARVNRAYHRLAPQPGHPVTLADLRGALPDITTTELDTALHHMTHPGDTPAPSAPLPATSHLRMTGEYADQPELDQGDLT